MDPSPSALQLEVASEEIRASYQPAGDAPPPSRDDLQQALSARGLQDCVFDEAAIEAFLARCAQGEVEPSPIGLRRDGRFEITLSANRLHVWLRVDPPQGGLPVSLERVQIALAERGVVYGLREDALREAVTAGRCEQCLIAEGREPEAGTPARFESLLSGRGVSDERGPVDYRELGALIVVDPGTPLMRRTPAQPGRDGRDVCGEVIAARSPPDLPFETVGGASPAPHDPDLLIASIPGLPSVGPRGVSVNPQVEVQDVDLQSGNIRFDGTVHVKGDIRAGMSVRVAGDVIVEGTVEAAEVQAGGHLIVKGGIIGRAEHGEASATARVRCQGDVQARFIEHADIEAGGDVRAEAGIRDSRVVAGEAVLVGASGSVVGGRTAAHRLIRTPVLGSAWGDPTEAQVGVNPFIDGKLATLRAAREKREAERAKLQQLLAYLAQQPAGEHAELRGKAQLTLQSCEQGLAATDAEMAGLAAQLALSDSACIEVQRCLHGGVRLMVGPSALLVKDERAAARVRRVDGQIVLL